MSRTELRLLAAIGAVAFGLRLGMAVVTQSRPLFPAYYYTDSRLIDEASAAVAEESDRGRPFAFVGNLSQLLQVRGQSLIYRVIGIRPFAMKALNAAMGAATVVAFGVGAGTLVTPPAALLAAAACAAWPSGIFYTSQNFKEAPTNFFAFLALAALLSALAERASRPWAWILLVCAATIMVGFYRAYILTALCATFAVVALLKIAAERRASFAGIAVLSVSLLVPAVYLPTARLLMRSLMGGAVSNDPRLQPQFIPVTYNEGTTARYSPTSPQGLSEFRRIRQDADRHWALANAGREIGTQIFPDARFSSWLDVGLFVPKAAFYVLFMPLPGLYPMAGKIGRMLAALENTALLVAACLGLAGFWRGPKTPARAALIFFFVGMTVGSSLLEFDLGSAGRHKLLYLPLLFPFAAEEFLRLSRRKESA